jgi:hypothetical protein
VSVIWTSAEEYIVGWAREFPRNKPFKITIHAPESELRSEHANQLREALNRYFAYRSEVVGRDLNELFRVGRHPRAGDVKPRPSGQLYARAIPVPIYPQEIEEAVANLPGVHKGGVAVFGVADQASGTERYLRPRRDTRIPGPTHGGTFNRQRSRREKLSGTRKIGEGSCLPLPGTMRSASHSGRALATADEVIE